MSLDKTYTPADVEQRIYEQWENSGAFACGKAEAQDAYTIVIPPPNVTGSLHMGHALNNTLQDILVRYNRMKGKDTLWQPGTDHAGIATQMVVERQMEAEKLTRHDLGRDKFIERVWDWKAESGGTITRQLRRLGASCDWDRERFTMDEGLSKAVQKVFVELHKQDLIYRDKRLVNWDPLLHTAISDLEVENKEQNGKMWYFKYPIEGRDGEFMTVGTTRPETMLGDTGVAVHPDDERYTDLVGKNVVLPLVGRVIPIVSDEYADPEKGSGAVKITPAHDFNDFEVGRRCKLDVINVLDLNAAIIGDADDANAVGIPEHLQGLDRFEARDAIVKEMEGLGLLEKVDENPMTVPYGDRSGVVIEPWLLDQWFVDAKKLAVEAIKAVEDGRTTFHPKQYENLYFEWMRNIQPWCVSRQIWWGHQIPAWYGPDGHPFVEYTEDDALAAAKDHYGVETALTRDPDVLDTWFSSALWPFSTLGWPDETPEVARYYPTDCLVTGFDIIFFWVARMMMMGLHFMDEVPFKDVYIHALVRDEKGQKMSKSKGNVMDPLELIDQFGADAVRFTMTSQAVQGRDVKLSVSRIEGYRNFVTKIWNVARFAEMNECKPVADFDPSSVKLTVNRWIIAKASEAAVKIETAINGYRFNEAADAGYHFTWGTYCAWYTEFTKPILNGDDEAAKAETRATMAWVLDQILLMLHPIMPYVTEELWANIADRDGQLMLQAWPDLNGLDAADAEAEMDWVVRLISGVRGVRSEMNVEPKAKLTLRLKDASAETLARLETHKDLIHTMARIEDSAALEGDVEKGSVSTILDEATVVLPLSGIIDVDAEKARLDKEIKKLAPEIMKYEKKLSNEGFLAKAPAEVVEEQRERLEGMKAERAKLDEALARLADL
ncbi:valine--tRNA ligase [Magnetovibrio sp. PR-2]|uniref:valine--tRNA ligase n=1 Tax=Magnetovibrio sp. PR-2 TaxID=3120356 RepID=UPI002FCDEBAB